MSYLQGRNMIEFLLVLLLIPLAVAIEGIRRKIVAHMHNRTGPPLMQPFYDVIKLFGKESFIRDNMIFSMVPYLAFLCSLVLAFIIPFSVLKFDFDFLLIGYLFILQDTFYIFGAVASRSPFGTYASVRELLLMLGYEIAFLVVISIFFFKTGAAGLADYDVEFAFLQMPFASIFLMFTAFVILRVTPFDVMVAAPEISAGFFSEYSGKKLALLELAEWLKDFLVYILLGVLLFGKVYGLLLAPLFMFFYAIMLTSSPRYSTVTTVKVFLVLALLAFLDLFILV